MYQDQDPGVVSEHQYKQVLICIFLAVLITIKTSRRRNFQLFKINFPGNSTTQIITNYFVIPSLHLNQTWLHLKQILSAMAKKNVLLSDQAFQPVAINQNYC